MSAANLAIMTGHYLVWPSSGGNARFWLSATHREHGYSASVCVEAWSEDGDTLTKIGARSVSLRAHPDMTLDEAATLNAAATIASGVGGDALDRILYALWWSLLRREPALREWVLGLAPAYARALSGVAWEVRP